MMKLMRRMTGEKTPQPQKMVITRWSGDRYSRGSYSHLPVGATADDYDQMAAPVGERLFFAGEATNSRFPATVHGALLSGIREANRLLTIAG